MDANDDVVHLINRLRVQADADPEIALTRAAQTLRSGNGDGSFNLSLHQLIDADDVISEGAWFYRTVVEYTVTGT